MSRLTVIPEGQLSSNQDWKTDGDRNRPHTIFSDVQR
jgi:hypothetical protein